MNPHYTAVFAGVLATAVAASAQVIPVPNGSFEDGAPSYGTPPSWTYVSDGSSQGRNDNMQVKTTPAPTGIDGVQFAALYLDNNDDFPTNATPDLPLTSTLTSSDLGVIAADTVYTFTLAMGGVNNGTPREYDLNILANGAVAASQTFGIDDLSDAAFLDKAVALDTSVLSGVVGQTLAVQLVLRSSFSFGRELLLDNARMVASPVPEPSSVAALIALGGLALAVSRRRR